MRGLDENGNNVDKPQLSGDIWVDTLLDFQLEEFEAAYPELTVHFNSYTTFTVNYYVGETLKHTVDNLAYGATPTYPGATPVMPGVNDPDNYEFVCWYPVLTSVERDMDVSAVFRRKDVALYGIIEATLSGAYINNRISTLRGYAFYGCSKVTSIELSATSIGEYAFYGCLALDTLILRSNTVVKRTSNMITNTPIASGNGYIYVPSSLYDAYLSDSSWSAIAGRFRKIEDYQEIIGG